MAMSDMEFIKDAVTSMQKDIADIRERIGAIEEGLKHKADNGDVPQWHSRAIQLLFAIDAGIIIVLLLAVLTK